ERSDVVRRSVVQSEVDDLGRWVKMPRRRSARTLLVVAASLSVAVASFAVGRGSASGPGREFQLYPYDTATFTRLDFGCTYLRPSDGRMVLCDRESSPAIEVGLTVTPGWIRVYRFNGTTNVKTLLFAQRRNP